MRDRLGPSAERPHSGWAPRRSDLTPEQHREYAAAWQRAFRATPEGQLHVRRMNLRAKGLTPEAYEAQHAAQGGVCAACGGAETGRNQYGQLRLAVDHDHRCCPPGRACDSCRRGLLCMRCNRALGLLGDHPDTIEALLTYRKSHS